MLIVRRIRDLVYDQGFNSRGARNKLQELIQAKRDKRKFGEMMLECMDEFTPETAADSAKVTLMKWRSEQKMPLALNAA